MTLLLEERKTEELKLKFFKFALEIRFNMRKYKIILFVSALLYLVSCEQNGADSLSTEESDIVATLYSDTCDFTRYSTYSIVDSVLTIDDEGERIRVLGEAERTILSSVISGMKNKGYTKVDTSMDPDLFIDVAAFTMTTSGSVWYPGYWGGWGYGGCWYYPCWGGFYPGYGGGGYTYSYETGSVAIDMFSLKGELDDEELLFVPWTVYLQGILSSSGVTNKSRIKTNVERAFDQSTYLDVK